MTENQIIKPDIFRESATNLYQNRISFVPTKGKIPVVQNWSRYADERQSKMVLESWEAQYPKNNIGVLLGPASGLVAIDYDGTMGDDELMQLLPKSPIERVGKKGFVRFFIYNGEKSRKFPALKVEIFSYGGQVLIPPSIHPETLTPYQWTGIKNLYDFDFLDHLSPLPPDLIEELERIDVRRKKAKKHQNQSEGRNNHLFKTCSSMVGKGTPIEEIKTHLIKIDQTEHDPPWFTDPTEPHKGDADRALNEMIDRVATLEQRNNFHEWEKPKKLKRALPKLPKFEKSGLPPSIANFCQFLSAELGAPPDFISTSLIVALSSLVSRIYVIQPYQKQDHWKIVPNLYGLIIGAPGLKKSPAMKRGAIKFISKIEKIYRNKDARELATIKTKKHQILIKIEDLNKQLKKKPDDLLLLDELTDLNGKLDKLKPKLQSILMNKITPASLVEIAGFTNKTLFIHRDELSSLFFDMGTKELGALKELLLEGWNGDNPYKKQTKTQGNDLVEKLSLSVLGAIQPSKIQPLFENIMNHKDNDGLFQRFQIVAFPEQLVRLSDTSSSSSELDSRFQKLFLELQAVDLLQNTPKVVHLNKEAQEIYRERLKKITDQQNSTREPIMNEYLAKFESLIPSLALIFKVSETEKRVELLKIHEIDSTCMDQAIQFSKYLEAHLRKMLIYFKHNFDDTTYLLGEKITEGKITDGMTVRDIKRADWSGLTNAKKIDSGLSELEEINWIRVEYKQTNGRPSPIVRFNPQILNRKLENLLQNEADQ